MANNPNTVWGTLSSPNSPIGSIPFVDTDGITIVTDVAHWKFTSGSATLTDTFAPYQSTISGGLRVGYKDTTATPGSVTNNQPAGRARLAAGTASITITSNYIFPTSMVFVTIETADATLTRLISVSYATGSMILTFNANATAATNVIYMIVNTCVPT